MHNCHHIGLAIFKLQSPCLKTRAFELSLSSPDAIRDVRAFKPLTGFFWPDLSAIEPKNDSTEILPESCYRPEGNWVCLPYCPSRKTTHSLKGMVFPVCLNSHPKRVSVHANCKLGLSARPESRPGSHA